MKLLAVLGIAIHLLACLAGAQEIDRKDELVWKEMAELPRPVGGYMAAESHGKLLVIGGAYWENEKKHWTDLVQSFDPRNNTWRNEAPLPAPLADAASATLGDRIYVFGGGSDDNITTSGLVLRAGRWKALPGADLPAPRRYASAVSAGGYIYVLGGMSKSGDYTTVTNTFWRWRPGIKKWEALPPLPGPGRINHAMVRIGKSIYVFGGANTKGRDDVESLKDVYKYDPASRSWTRLPDLEKANHAWWAVSLDERALLVGGYTDTFARDVGIYDPRTGKLQPVTPLPRGVADMKFSLVGNLLIVTGGEVGVHIRGKWTTMAEIPTAWLSKASSAARSH